jgi:hypothetical protein
MRMIAKVLGVFSMGFPHRSTSCAQIERFQVFQQTLKIF